MATNRDAKKVLCRNCLFSKKGTGSTYWKCTKGRDPKLALKFCGGYCCGERDKITGVRHKQSKCYICGKPTYSDKNDIALYCSEHKAYASEDDSVLANMPYELMFMLITGIFERARDDYINNTDNAKEDAKKFFESRWAKSLAMTEFDSDEIIRRMDKEAENES